MDEIMERLAALESRVAELERKKVSARFKPPTIQELTGHIREKGYSFDAMSFIMFYDSNGWKVGRNKMKSWQSACVTWHKREVKYGKSKSAYQHRIEAGDERSFNIDTNF